MIDLFRFLIFAVQTDKDDPTGTSWTKHIPVVEVSAKITMISDINLADQTYRASFILYLEWFDPSIYSPEEAHSPDKHFVPAITFENNVEKVEAIGKAVPR